MKALWHSYQQAREYERALRGFHPERSKEASGAVVVHVYYPAMWPVIRDRLELVPNGQCDLYVTTPKHNGEFTRQLASETPGARVLIAPNRGRDILPFLHVASALSRLGYEYVLKLHTKQSPHFDGGAVWFETLLTTLLPERADVRARLWDVLHQPSTAMVGPSDHYLALPVNYPANRHHILGILSEVAGQAAATQVDLHQWDYGFFAGSMFWARFDAIRPLADRYCSVRHFEAEDGQIDGTFAHALERVISLLPQLSGRALYAIDGQDLQRIGLGSGTVPQWSDLHQRKS
jgi:lipopolysaccharide biosynthesis protein